MDFTFHLTSGGTRTVTGETCKIDDKEITILDENGKILFWIQKVFAAMIIYEKPNVKLVSK
jgi:hypothetical protein